MYFVQSFIRAGWASMTSLWTLMGQRSTHDEYYQDWSAAGHRQKQSSGNMGNFKVKKMEGPLDVSFRVQLHRSFEDQCFVLRLHLLCLQAALEAAAKKIKTAYTFSFGMVSQSRGSKEYFGAPATGALRIAVSQDLQRASPEHPHYCISRCREVEWRVLAVWWWPSEQCKCQHRHNFRCQSGS